MLNSAEINIHEIYSEYKDFAGSVGKSVMDGNSEYLKPITLKSIASYKTPYQQQSVRASLIWNACFPKEFISDNSAFKVLELKGIPTAADEIKEEVDEGNELGTSKAVNISYEMRPEFKEFLKDNFSKDQYKRLIEMFNQHPQMLKYGIAQVAIPSSAKEIPKEFLKFSDLGSVTNSVLSKGNILLESLGFVLVKSRSRQVVSNMIRV